MAKRYDYRRQYKDMTLEQLKSSLEYQLDKFAKYISDDLTEEASKHISYLRAKIAKVSGESDRIYQI